MRAATTLLLASLTAPVAAQIVVDPTGASGAFTELQDAIDAAPPGAVIRVLFGTFEGITVDKSLTIIGGPFVHIHSTRAVGPRLVEPILLRGSGQDRLVLSHVIVSGSWGTRGELTPAISGSGFAHLGLHDANVRGPEFFHPLGTVVGQPAVDLPDLQTLTVVRTDARASWSWAGPAGGWSPDGAPAIRVPAATVTVADADIHGGDASNVNTSSPPSPFPCPCPAATGRSGDGVVAARVFEAGSTITAGRGSTVMVGGYSWGAQPDGVPVVAADHVVLPHVLSAAESPRLGAPFVASVPWTLLPSALLVGTAGPPVPVPYAGYLFLDLTRPWLAVTVEPFTPSLALPIPAAPVLAGARIDLQLVELRLTGQPFLLSNPLLEVVTW